MKNFTKILVVALLLVMVMGIQSVNATPMLRFTYNSDAPIIVADGDSDGIISFGGPIGNFFVSSTGLTKPFAGNALEPSMDLNSLVATAVGGSTLEIAFTDTLFYSSTEISNFYTFFGGTAINSEVSFSFYLDTLNNPFGTGTLLAESTVSAIGSFEPFSDIEVTSLALDLTEPFSLTMIAAITNGEGYGSTSFNANIEIPEPATLILLGSGLIGAAVYGRRKKVS